MSDPVAWMVYTVDGESAYVTNNPADIQPNQRALPLFTNSVAESDAIKALRGALERIVNASIKNGDYSAESMKAIARAALKEQR